MKTNWKNNNWKSQKAKPRRPGIESENKEPKKEEMPSTVNHKKYNHQKAFRTNRRLSKLHKSGGRVTRVERVYKVKNSEAENEAIVSMAAEEPVLKYQIRARASNPTARISLTKKKEKKLRKLAWISNQANASAAAAAVEDEKEVKVNSSAEAKDMMMME